MCNDIEQLSVTNRIDRHEGRPIIIGPWVCAM